MLPNADVRMGGDLRISAESLDMNALLRSSTDIPLEAARLASAAAAASGAPITGVGATGTLSALQPGVSTSQILRSLPPPITPGIVHHQSVTAPGLSPIPSVASSTHGPAVVHLPTVTSHIGTTTTAPIAMAGAGAATAPSSVPDAPTTGVTPSPLNYLGVGAHPALAVDATASALRAAVGYTPEELFTIARQISMAETKLLGGEAGHPLSAYVGDATGVMKALPSTPQNAPPTAGAAVLPDELAVLSDCAVVGVQAGSTPLRTPTGTPTPAASQVLRDLRSLLAWKGEQDVAKRLHTRLSIGALSGHTPSVENLLKTQSLREVNAGPGDIYRYASPTAAASWLGCSAGYLSSAGQGPTSVFVDTDETASAGFAQATTEYFLQRDWKYSPALALQAKSGGTAHETLEKFAVRPAINIPNDVSLVNLQKSIAGFAAAVASTLKTEGNRLSPDAHNLLEVAHAAGLLTPDPADVSLPVSSLLPTTPTAVITNATALSATPIRPHTAQFALASQFLVLVRYHTGSTLALIAEAALAPVTAVSGEVAPLGSSSLDALRAELTQDTPRPEGPSAKPGPFESVHSYKHYTLDAMLEKLAKERALMTQEARKELDELARRRLEIAQSQRGPQNGRTLPLLPPLLSLGDPIFKDQGLNAEVDDEQLGQYGTHAPLAAVLAAITDLCHDHILSPAHADAAAQLVTDLALREGGIPKTNSPLLAGPVVNAEAALSCVVRVWMRAYLLQTRIAQTAFLAAYFVSVTQPELIEATLRVLNATEASSQAEVAARQALEKHLNESRDRLSAQARDQVLTLNEGAPPDGCLDYPGFHLFASCLAPGITPFESALLYQRALETLPVAHELPALEPIGDVSAGSTSATLTEAAAQAALAKAAGSTNGASSAAIAQMEALENEGKAIAAAALASWFSRPCVTMSAAVRAVTEANLLPTAFCDIPDSLDPPSPPATSDWVSPDSKQFKVLSRVLYRISTVAKFAVTNLMLGCSTAEGMRVNAQQQQQTSGAYEHLMLQLPKLYGSLSLSEALRANETGQSTAATALLHTLASLLVFRSIALPILPPLPTGLINSAINAQSASAWSRVLAESYRGTDSFLLAQMQQGDGSDRIGHLKKSYTMATLSHVQDLPLLGAAELNEMLEGAINSALNPVVRADTRYTLAPSLPMSPAAIKLDDDYFVDLLTTVMTGEPLPQPSMRLDSVPTKNQLQVATNQPEALPLTRKPLIALVFAHLLTQVSERSDNIGGIHYSLSQLVPGSHLSHAEARRARFCRGAAGALLVLKRILNTLLAGGYLASLPSGIGSACIACAPSITTSASAETALTAGSRMGGPPGTQLALLRRKLGYLGAMLGAALSESHESLVQSTTTSKSSISRSQAPPQEKIDWTWVFIGSGSGTSVATPQLMFAALRLRLLLLAETVPAVPKVQPDASPSKYQTNPLSVASAAVMVARLTPDQVKESLLGKVQSKNTSGDGSSIGNPLSELAGPTFEARLAADARTVTESSATAKTVLSPITALRGSSPTLSIDAVTIAVLDAYVARVEDRYLTLVESLRNANMVTTPSTAHLALGSFMAVVTILISQAQAQNRLPTYLSPSALAAQLIREVLFAGSPKLAPFIPIPPIYGLADPSNTNVSTKSFWNLTHSRTAAGHVAAWRQAYMDAGGRPLPLRLPNRITQIINSAGKAINEGRTTSLSSELIPAKNAGLPGFDLIPTVAEQLPLRPLLAMIASASALVQPVPEGTIGAPMLFGPLAEIQARTFFRSLARMLQGYPNANATHGAILRLSVNAASSPSRSSQIAERARIPGTGLAGGAHGPSAISQATSTSDLVYHRTYDDARKNAEEFSRAVSQGVTSQHGATSSALQFASDRPSAAQQKADNLAGLLTSAVPVDPSTISDDPILQESQAKVTAQQLAAEEKLGAVALSALVLKLRHAQRVNQRIVADLQARLNIALGELERERAAHRATGDALEKEQRRTEEVERILRAEADGKINELKEQLQETRAELNRLRMNAAEPPYRDVLRATGRFPARFSEAERQGKEALEREKQKIKAEFAQMENALATLNGENARLREELKKARREPGPSDVGYADFEQARALRQEVESLRRQLETAKSELLQIRNREANKSTLAEAQQEEDGNAKVTPGEGTTPDKDTLPLDVGSPSTAVSEAARWRREYEALRARHAEQLKELQSKLDWYVENQQLISQYEEREVRLTEQIKALSQELSDWKTLAVNGTADAGAVAAVARRGRYAAAPGALIPGVAESSLREREMAQKRIRELEQQVASLEDIIRKRNPGSAAAIILANRPSVEETRVVVELQERLTIAENALQEAEKKYKLRLRTLAQENERARLAYERRLEMIQQRHDKDLENLRALKPTARVKELEKELDQSRLALMTQIRNQQDTILKLTAELARLNPNNPSAVTAILGNSQSQQGNQPANAPTNLRCTCPYHPTNLLSTNPNAAAHVLANFPGHLTTCPLVVAWVADPRAFPVAPAIAAEETVVALFGEEALRGVNIVPGSGTPFASIGAQSNPLAHTQAQAQVQGTQTLGGTQTGSSQPPHVRVDVATNGVALSASGATDQDSVSKHSQLKPFLASVAAAVPGGQSKVGRPKQSYASMDRAALLREIAQRDRDIAELEARLSVALAAGVSHVLAGPKRASGRPPLGQRAPASKGTSSSQTQQSNDSQYAKVSVAGSGRDDVEAITDESESGDLVTTAHPGFIAIEELDRHVAYVKQHMRETHERELEAQELRFKERLALATRGLEEQCEALKAQIRSQNQLFDAREAELRAQLSRAQSQWENAMSEVHRLQSANGELSLMLARLREEPAHARAASLLQKIEALEEKHRQQVYDLHSAMLTSREQMELERHQAKQQLETLRLRKDAELAATRQALDLLLQRLRDPATWSKPSSLADFIRDISEQLQHGIAKGVAPATNAIDTDSAVAAAARRALAKGVEGVGEVIRQVVDKVERGEPVGTAPSGVSHSASQVDTQSAPTSIGQQYPPASHAPTSPWTKQRAGWALTSAANSAAQAQDLLEQHNQLGSQQSQQAQSASTSGGAPRVHTTTVTSVDSCANPAEVAATAAAAALSAPSNAQTLIVSAPTGAPVRAEIIPPLSAGVNRDGTILTPAAIALAAAAGAQKASVLSAPQSGFTAQPPPSPTPSQAPLLNLGVNAGLGSPADQAALLSALASAGLNSASAGVNTEKYYYIHESDQTACTQPLTCSEVHRQVPAHRHGFDSPIRVRAPKPAAVPGTPASHSSHAATTRYSTPSRMKSTPSPLGGATPATPYDTRLVFLTPQEAQRNSARFRLTPDGQHYYFSDDEAATELETPGVKRERLGRELHSLDELGPVGQGADTNSQGEADFQAILGSAFKDYARATQSGTTHGAGFAGAAASVTALPASTAPSSGKDDADVAQKTSKATSGANPQPKTWGATMIAVQPKTGGVSRASITAKAPSTATATGTTATSKRAGEASRPVSARLPSATAARKSTSTELVSGEAVSYHAAKAAQEQRLTAGARRPTPPQRPATAGAGASTTTRHVRFGPVDTKVISARQGNESFESRTTATSSGKSAPTKKVTPESILDLDPDAIRDMDIDIDFAAFALPE